MIDNHNFVDLTLADSDTFGAENYDDLTSTLEPSVQHTQSVVQIGAQRSSRMKDQVSVRRRDARKYNIMKFELEKAKKGWAREKKKKEIALEKLGRYQS